MMTSKRIEIYVGDNDDIALVNLYFKGERSLKFSKWSLGIISHCNRSSSL